MKKDPFLLRLPLRNASKYVSPPWVQFVLPPGCSFHEQRIGLLIFGRQDIFRGLEFKGFSKQGAPEQPRNVRA